MIRTAAAALLAAVLLAGCGTSAQQERPTGADSTLAAVSAETSRTPDRAGPEVTGEVSPENTVEQASDAGSTADASAGSTTGGTEAGGAEAAGTELGPLYDVLSVYDGDTIAVSVDGRRERIRVIGINAPEMARAGNPAECYAQESASRMQSLVQSQRVHLLADPTQDDRDRYDRLLRHVVREGGGHVAYLLVAEGMAVERQYAAPYQYQADLLAAQEQARSLGLGLWSACAAPPGVVPVAPVAPAPAPAPAPSAPAPSAPAPAPAECVIKGNIASDGERIYHVPGQQYYDVTVVSPHKGERWFCTEQEAVDAGWRKAKV